MRDDTSWAALGVKAVIIVIMLVGVAFLTQCNNETGRKTCESKGGQYIENDYDSTRSSCVLPRRWS